MPKAKYHDIYRDLKQKIEDEEYAYQDFLPSENSLIQTYHCSRNTIRRAISQLVSDGYVANPCRAKAYANIYLPVSPTYYTIGGIESFKEASLRNHQKARTRVLQFIELTADEKNRQTKRFFL